MSKRKRKVRKIELQETASVDPHFTEVRKSYLYVKFKCGLFLIIKAMQKSRFLQDWNGAALEQGLLSVFTGGREEEARSGGHCFSPSENTLF